jgi:putative ABC transport system permease protein
MGIRLVLGATKIQLVRYVMSRGLRLSVTGVVLGTVGALGANRLLSSLLFGVQPTDPLTMGLAGTSTMALAIVACWIPAWRVSQLDPNMVLRAD